MHVECVDKYWNLCPCKIQNLLNLNLYLHILLKLAEVPGIKHQHCRSLSVDVHIDNVRRYLNFVL